MTGAGTPTTLSDLTREDPTNWGRWGDGDEVGSLNHLTPANVIAAAGEVRSGRVFTLGIPLGLQGGDPVWPGRDPARHEMVLDAGSYERGEAEPLQGGYRFSDDVITMSLHGTTHCDALGHAWAGDQLYNGFPASSTTGGLRHVSVEPIARRGIAGRGVLLDVARHLGKNALDPGEAIGWEVLQACADAQGTELRPGDALLIRTGWIPRFYRAGAESFYSDFREPGLAYTPELARWFAERSIVSLVTDTFGNEVSAAEETGFYGPIHIALLHRLGIVFTELAWLDDLAADCVDDGRWSFMYVCAPIRIVGATGAPVNPIALK
jgi:kynurenine formamidase